MVVNISKNNTDILKRTILSHLGGEFLELLFEQSKIREYASEYDADYDIPIENLVPDVKKKGYLNASDLLQISNWKLWTGRNTHNIQKNNDIAVEEMTYFALTAKSEVGRINCLLSLGGVNLAVGSAILHWFHKDDYPIWDWRALETVQFDKSQYKNWFQRWEAYVSFCRITAKENDVDMRTLDRALWQYSKKQ